MISKLHPSNKIIEVQDNQVQLGVSNFVLFLTEMYPKPTFRVGSDKSFNNRICFSWFLSK